jgi:ATP-dependent Clp protease adapter protein ClpS
MTDNTTPEVTAVGRLLQPKHGEPHVYKVIAIDDYGTVTTVIEEPIETAFQDNA